MATPTTPVPRDLVGDSAFTARVAGLVAPALAARGFALVRVLLGGGPRPKLQVMIERAGGAGVDAADCAAASRLVSALLDVDDPIAGAYELEVSSPGIDRPLTRREDFVRWAGHEVRIELRRAQPAPGGGARRRYTGRLLGLAGDTVTLETGGARVALPFAALAKARLVLTDALIGAAR